MARYRCLRAAVACRMWEIHQNPGAMGLFRGLVAPFRGLLFIGRERLWRFLVLPTLLNALLSTLTFWGAWRYWRAEDIVTHQASAVLRMVILVLLAGLLGAALFLVAHPILDA